MPLLTAGDPFPCKTSGRCLLPQGRVIPEVNNITCLNVSSIPGASCVQFWVLEQNEHEITKNWTRRVTVHACVNVCGHTCCVFCNLKTGFVTWAHLLVIAVGGKLLQKKKKIKKKRLTFRVEPLSAPHTSPCTKLAPTTAELEA